MPPTDPTTTNSGSAPTGAPVAPNNAFVMTDGWYLALFVITSVMVADTRVGPIFFGIGSIALIYQVNLWLQHK